MGISATEDADPIAARLAAITRRQIFAGARRIAARQWQRSPNWVVAMEVFGVGSTYACVLCREMGLDPDSRKASRWPEAEPAPCAAAASDPPSPDLTDGGTP